MPQVRVSEHSHLAPEIVLAAVRDFCDRRAQRWPDFQVEYLRVDEVGDDYAEVTEGNPRPIGHVWERLHYYCSEPGVLRGRSSTPTCSNREARGSYGRHPRMTEASWKSGPCGTYEAVGWLLAPFFLPFSPVRPRRQCGAICVTF
jgi:hypothetical protein